MQDKTKDVISIALAGLVLMGLLYGKENKRNKIESTSVINIENQLPISVTMKDTWYEVETLKAPFDEKLMNIMHLKVKIFIYIKISFIKLYKRNYFNILQ